MTDLPLSGTVVLDLSQIYNGPYATFMMAAAGADVIKIEPPGGEHMRRRTVDKGPRLPYAMLNAGKRSLCLDLKTAAGRDILLRLAEVADVLVENFAPGVLDKLGLGAAVLRARNPRLVYASSSGYGADGPYRDYPAMDLTVQAMSGIMSVTGYPGEPPLKAGPALCDFNAGVHLYGAVVTALLQRAHTGRGCAVEVSMLEASYFSLASSLGMIYAQPDRAYARTGNRHGGLTLCPYNVYPAKDGHIAIIVNHEEHWKSLLTALGQEALIGDPRYSSMQKRASRMDEVDALVSSWTQPLPRDELFARLVAHRVACAPVRELVEVMHDPHLHARGALRWVEHPEYGRIAATASPLRFDGKAMLPEPPSVPLGADSRTVLQEKLGMSDVEIKSLHASGVICGAI
ncbi:MAG: CoA transferase [Pseudomonadota bacterium]